MLSIQSTINSKYWVEKNIQISALIKWNSISKNIVNQKTQRPRPIKRKLRYIRCVEESPIKLIYLIYPLALNVWINSLGIQGNIFGCICVIALKTTCLSLCYTLLLFYQQPIDDHKLSPSSLLTPFRDLLRWTAVQYAQHIRMMLSEVRRLSTVVVFSIGWIKRKKKSFVIFLKITTSHLQSLSSAHRDRSYLKTE